MGISIKRALGCVAVAAACALGGTAIGGGSAAVADGPRTASNNAVWTPAPGTTWQWQITGTVTEPFLNVDMYDIDLQDAVPADTTVNVPGIGSAVWPRGKNAGIINKLHNPSDGSRRRTVICYLDTGAWESYRPDKALFPGTPGANSNDPQSDVILAQTTRSGGEPWEGEFWLDIRQQQWFRFAPIIWSRLDLAKQIGCDGVEGDQNNPVGNSPGRKITLADQKAWYLKVAEQAHARGLSAGMKNGVESTDATTAAAFDWNLNEECYFYEECGDLQPFRNAGKAIFNTEYTDDWKTSTPPLNTPAKVAAKVCPWANRDHISTLVKNVEPDELFVHCWP